MYIAQKLPDNQTTVGKVQDVAMTGYYSCEDHASDILCCHYDTLSLSLQYPIKVAQILCGEGVISDTALTMYSHPLMSLLNAVRSSVHINYRNLKVFAIVLQRFTDNKQLGDIIMNDYGKIYGLI